MWSTIVIDPIHEDLSVDKSHSLMSPAYTDDLNNLAKLSPTQPDQLAIDLFDPN